MNNIIDSIEGTSIVVVGDKGKKVELSILDLFNIDDQNLVEEYTKQASIYAWIAVLTAKAEFNMANAEIASEREYAMADQSFREELTMKDAKITEPMVRQLISTDVAYQSTQDSFQLAKYEHKLLKAIASALEMRANMLISLGAYMRHEMDMTGMKIKQHQYDEAVDETKKILQSRRNK